MPSSKRRYQIMNIGRAALALLMFASQSPPLVHWRWHEAILIGGLSIFTIDWFLGVRFVQSRAKPLFAAGGVYCAATAIGLVIAAHHGSRRALEVTAVVVVAAAFIALVLALRIGRSTKELDRLIFSEASSISFFTTMIALITIALIDGWLGYHAPSPWAFVIVGAASWVVARAVLQSRYH